MPTYCMYYVLLDHPEIPDDDATTHQTSPEALYMLSCYSVMSLFRVQVLQPSSLLCFNSWLFSKPSTVIIQSSL